VQCLVDALGAAVEEQQRRETQSCDTLTAQVAEFAYAVLEAMFGRELALATDPVRDAVGRALQLAPERTTALVLVHPDDAAAFAPDDDVWRGRTAEVVADPSVAKGGCVVRAGDCEIDGRFDAALERLRTVLHTEVGS
jgi:flagellar assembly protein FliH